jgi:hypothetical protein
VYNVLCESENVFAKDPMVFDCGLTENGIASLALKAQDAAAFCQVIFVTP